MGPQKMRKRSTQGSKRQPKWSPNELPNPLKNHQQKGPTNQQKRKPKIVFSRDLRFASWFPSGRREHAKKEEKEGTQHEEGRNTKKEGTKPLRPQHASGAVRPGADFGDFGGS